MDKINFIDAMPKGVVEYGDIVIEIDGTEEWIEIQERAEFPFFRAFVNNAEIFEKSGIQMEYDEIKDEKFLDELAHYYSIQSLTHR